MLLNMHNSLIIFKHIVSYNFFIKFSLFKIQKNELKFLKCIINKILHYLILTLSLDPMFSNILLISS